MIIARLDHVREPRPSFAQSLGPFLAAIDALRIGGVGKPQRGELGHEGADRVLAGFHAEIRPGAAILQRLRPSMPSARPAMTLERPDYACLHEARLADTGVAHERNEPTGRGNDLVDDFAGLAFTAEEEVGVLFLQRDEAAIGIDGPPGFRRLCDLAGLKRHHDLRQRIGRGRLRALDPVQLCEARQVGGRPLGAIGDDDRQQDEGVILHFAVERLVILELLPIAGPVGDEDQERLGLGDGVEQARLPKMPVAQMRLIDEYIGAAQAILDRTLEAECDSAVGGVIAQEDTQHSSHPQGLWCMNDAYCLTVSVPHDGSEYKI